MKLIKSQNKLENNSRQFMVNHVVSVLEEGSFFREVFLPQ